MEVGVETFGEIAIGIGVERGIQVVQFFRGVLIQRVQSLVAGLRIGPVRPVADNGDRGVDKLRCLVRADAAEGSGGMGDERADAVEEELLKPAVIHLGFQPPDQMEGLFRLGKLTKQIGIAQPAVVPFGKFEQTLDVGFLDRHRSELLEIYFARGFNRLWPAGAIGIKDM